MTLSFTISLLSNEFQQNLFLLQVTHSQWPENLPLTIPCISAWENEINLKRLKTKVLSLAYSLEDNYVDDSREILDEILKDNDSEVPSDDDEVVRCVKTEKENLMYEEIKNL